MDYIFMLPKLSKNTKLLSFASFLTDASSEMIIPLLPFFLTQTLLAPVWVAGLVEGLREFTANATGIFSGIYSDKTGKRKPIVIAGYALSTLTKSLLLAATSWMQVIGIVFFERMGKGLRGPPRDALLNASEPEENLGKAFGFRKMLDNAGAILGPLVVIMLFAVILTPGAEESYRAIFGLALVPAFLAVLLLFFLEEKQNQAQSARKIMTDILQTKNFKAFFLAMGIFALGVFAIPLFLLRTGEYIPLLLIPLAYLAYNVFFTVFAMPAGYVTDKLGGKRALLVAQVLFLCALIGFAFFINATSVFLLFPLLGIFMAFYETAPRVFLAKIVEEKRYASAIGIYQGVLGVAAFGANVLAGSVWEIQLFQVPAPFVFSMTTTLLALGTMGILVKD